MYIQKIIVQAWCTVHSCLSTSLMYLIFPGQLSSILWGQGKNLHIIKTVSFLCIVCYFIQISDVHVQVPILHTHVNLSHLTELK